MSLLERGVVETRPIGLKTECSVLPTTPSRYEFVYGSPRGPVLGEVTYAASENATERSLVLQGGKRIEPIMQELYATRDAAREQGGSAAGYAFFDTFLWEEPGKIAHQMRELHIPAVTVGAHRMDQRTYFRMGIDEMARFHHVGLSHHPHGGTPITSVVAESAGCLVALELLRMKMQNLVDMPYFAPQRMVLVNAPLGGVAQYVRSYYPVSEKLLRNHTAMQQVLEIDPAGFLKVLREDTLTHMDLPNFPELFLISGYLRGSMTAFLDRSGLPIGKKLRERIVHAAGTGDAVVDFKGALGTKPIRESQSLLSHPSGKARAIVLGTMDHGSSHSSAIEDAADLVVALSQQGRSGPITYEGKPVSFERTIQVIEPHPKHIHIPTRLSPKPPERRESASGQPIHVAYMIAKYPGFQYNAGGAERHLQRMVSGLGDLYGNKYARTIFVAAPADHIKSYATGRDDNGLRIVGNASVPSVTAYLRNHREHIDILHLGDGWPITKFDEFIALQSVWRKPIILRVTSFKVMDRFAEFPRPLMDWYLRGIRMFISQSDEITAGLLKHGVQPDRITQIDNGVDSERFYPVASQEEKRALRRQLLPQIPEDARIYVYTGRITSMNKRINELLAEWERLEMKKHNAWLLLVGAPHTGKDHDGEALFRAYGGGAFGQPGKANTYWTGSVPEQQVSNLLRASDVFVLPSTDEGFSNSLLEALATGIPAVARAGVSGNGRVVRHGSTGLFFDNAPGSMGATLLAMLDEDRRAAMGVNAQQLIQQEFTITQMAKTYNRLYTKLLGRSEQ
jgi:glycosyltransferase involved in cell wall biosynthesis